MEKIDGYALFVLSIITSLLSFLSLAFGLNSLFFSICRIMPSS